MAGNDRGWREMAGDVPKLARNGPKWLRMAGNGPKWPGMARNWPGVPVRLHARVNVLKGNYYFTYTLEKAKLDSTKKVLLLKNPQFLSNHNETLLK